MTTVPGAPTCALTPARQKEVHELQPSPQTSPSKPPPRAFREFGSFEPEWPVLLGRPRSKHCSFLHCGPGSAVGSAARQVSGLSLCPAQLGWARGFLHSAFQSSNWNPACGMQTQGPHVRSGASPVSCSLCRAARTQTAKRPSNGQVMNDLGHEDGGWEDRRAGGLMRQRRQFLGW